MLLKFCFHSLTTVPGRSSEYNLVSRNAHLRFVIGVFDKMGFDHEQCSKNWYHPRLWCFC